MACSASKKTLSPGFSNSRALWAKSLPCGHFPICWDALCINFTGPGVKYCNRQSVQLLGHVQLFAAPWTSNTPCNTPGFRILHYLLVFAQTHVHWVSDAIQPSSSVIPVSSCLQSFPTSGSFPVSWLFTSGSQSIGASASASVLPMNIQDWFPLGWTGWIFLLPKWLSRVLSNNTVQKHQFFGTQLSL